MLGINCKLVVIIHALIDKLLLYFFLIYKNTSKKMEKKEIN